MQSTKMKLIFSFVLAYRFSGAILKPIKSLNANGWHNIQYILMKEVITVLCRNIIIRTKSLNVSEHVYPLIPCGL
jgi:hypothetical protein